MRTATIALKVNVDDTKLVGHSAHLKELVALLKATTIQGTSTFGAITTAAAGSITVLRNLVKATNNLNSAFMDVKGAIEQNTKEVYRNTGALIDNTLAVERADNAMSKVGEEMEKFNARADAAGKTIEKKRGFIERWGYALTRASAIIRSIGYLANELFTGMQKSAERIDLTNTLGNQFVDLEGKIERLKFKTANMVDRESILRSMALMSAFNLPMENFAEQVELINKMAIRTGQSVQYMMDSFARGISRLSAPILDNLGIQVVLKDVYKDFAMQIGKTTDELTKFEKQTAVTNYVLEVMKDKTAGIELSDTIAAQVRSLKNDFTELTNSVTDFLVEAAVGGANFFRDVFGSDLDKYTHNIRFSLSETAKELVEYKKQGLDADNELVKAAQNKFNVYMREVEFLTENAKLQEKILADRKMLALMDKDPTYRQSKAGSENSFDAITARLKAFEDKKEFTKFGPEMVKEYYNSVFTMLEESFLSDADPKTRELVRKNITAYLNKEVPKVISTVKNTLSGDPEQLINLIDIFNSDPQEGRFAAEQLMEDFMRMLRTAESGIAKNTLIDSMNAGYITLGDNILRASENQDKLAAGASATDIEYDNLQEDIGKLVKQYKELTIEQQKFINANTEEDKVKAKNVGQQLVATASKIANMRTEANLLRQQKETSDILNKIQLSGYKTYEDKIKNLAPAALAAEIALLEKAQARLGVENAMIKLQGIGIGLAIEQAAAVMPMLTMLAPALKMAAGSDPGIRAHIDKALADAKAALAKARAASGSGGGLTTVEPPKEESEYARRLRELKQLAEARQKFEKVESDFIEKRGALLAKFDETKDVREIDKLYVEYVRLSRAAEEAGVYFSSMFTEQDEQIRLIWLQANAVHALAQEFDNANTIATYLGGTLQGFVGQDVLKGLSDFAASMHNVSEAFRTQGNAYTHMSAATSVIKSFTDFLIKDKKKLAWVNMVFEVGQAWAAWATPGMQAKAVAHSISAATFGLIAGGVLKLPSGTQSTRTDSGKSITPPPITINVIGDIAQTEADRGVMIQRSLDEARRMGRI